MFTVGKVKIDALYVNEAGVQLTEVGMQCLFCFLNMIGKAPAPQMSSLCSYTAFLPTCSNGLCLLICTVALNSLSILVNKDANYKADDYNFFYGNILCCM